MKRTEKKICIIDNYDSFTYNLVAAVKKLQISCDVYRNNDEMLISKEITMYAGFIISPGPSNPGNAGYSVKVLSAVADRKPILGVCLGMQIINEYFGGKTIKAPTPVHGKTCRITLLKDEQLFKNLPHEIEVARYHSLICSEIRPPLQITATYGNIPMALRHQSLPVFGVQFHPESFLTPMGDQIIQNFVEVVREAAY